MRATAKRPQNLADRSAVLLSSQRMASTRRSRVSVRVALVGALCASGCALPHASLRADARADRSAPTDADELDSGVGVEDTGVVVDVPGTDLGVDTGVDTGIDTGVDSGIAADAPDPPPDVPCGRGGQMCCGTMCNGALMCVAGVCRACGGANQPCCGGTSCSPGNACEGGTCRACGRTGEPCCGTSCGPGLTCIPFGAFSICANPVGCGGLWQVCCGGRCNAGDCIRGSVCGACGGEGEPCLPGTCECRDGRTCSATSRCR